MISDEIGQLLLKTARDAMYLYLRHRRITDKPKKYPAELDAHGGVLIEIYKHVPGTAVRQLKGSAAVLETEKPILDNLLESAILAMGKPPGIGLDELPVVEIEVSVIGGMEDITAHGVKDYSRRIALGRDGLFVRKGIMRGIMMPSVPVERKWTVQETLENMCLKAGLLKESWADPAAHIFRFTPQTFREK